MSEFAGGWSSGADRGGGSLHFEKEISTTGHQSVRQPQAPIRRPAHCCRAIKFETNFFFAVEERRQGRACPKEHEVPAC